MRIVCLVSRLGLCSLLFFTAVASGAGAQAPDAVEANVTVTDADGNELGTISVEDVEDPFEGYAEGYEPADETRYALVTAAFEATGEAPFEANPRGLVLRDSDGHHWTPYSIVREDDNPPELQAQTMSPGNRISGVVGFQIPEDVELSALYYQPESSRLILLAELQEEPAPGPVLGDEVSYASMETEGVEGIVVVQDIEDPFDDLAEGYEPAEDSRYLLMTVSFEATGDQPLDADPYDLLLRDTDGFVWSHASVPREDDSAPELQSQTLSPGNRISGVVGFQIPENSELAELFWQPESGRLIRLVDFQADPGEADDDENQTPDDDETEDDSTPDD